MRAQCALRVAAVVVSLFACVGCAPNQRSVQAKTTVPIEAQAQTDGQMVSRLHITGLVRAVRVYAIQTPQITLITQASSQNNRLTLVRLVENGAHVKEGDLLAEFDNTRQLDEALEAEAKYDDLGHQATQKSAENQSDARSV